MFAGKTVPKHFNFQILASTLAALDYGSWEYGPLGVVFDLSHSDASHFSYFETDAEHGRLAALLSEFVADTHCYGYFGI